MLADRLDRLWLKIFLRDWIKTGKALHKLSPNKELAIELNNLYKIYLKL